MYKPTKQEISAIDYAFNQLFQKYPEAQIAKSNHAETAPTVVSMLVDIQMRVVYANKIFLQKAADRAAKRIHQDAWAERRKQLTGTYAFTIDPEQYKHLMER